VIPASLIAVPEEAPASQQYAPSAAVSTGAFAAAPSGVALDVRPAPPRQQIAPPGARTANGLAKRPPRGADARLRRPERPAPTEPAPPHRTPGEVQSMLTNFRSGYQRAEQTLHNEPGTESRPHGTGDI